MIDGAEHAIGGLLATLLLTTVMSISVGLGISRMNIPLMLGTMFSPDRDQARWVGFAVHLMNGWIFALFYLRLMDALGVANGWIGAAIGAFHALFVLSALMGFLPAIHPRMATEERGPDPTRQLEPPGFFALNYGKRTPIVTFVAHVLYGSVLGIVAA